MALRRCQTLPPPEQANHATCPREGPLRKPWTCSENVVAPVAPAQFPQIFCLPSPRFWREKLRWDVAAPASTRPRSAPPVPAATTSPEQNVLKVETHEGARRPQVSRSYLEVLVAEAPGV